MHLDDILEHLQSLADPDALEGMARYGIGTQRALGVRIPHLRRLAKRIGTDHALAAQLWAAAYRETRILASMVDDPAQVSEEQAEAWAADFADWEVCDQCCMNLLAYLPFARRKAVEWAGRNEEFVKRAGFVLMARLAVSDKQAGDDVFQAFLPIIVREAGDGRNFVRKAVNWALRQIGKRNLALNAKAIAAAEEISSMEAKPARWVASDALRELTSEPVQERLRAREP